MAEERKYFLAGDIGGTKTLLGLFAVQKGKFDFVERKRFLSRDYSKLGDIIDAFLKKIQRKVSKSSTCFGIAGPCEGGVCKTRNLPWTIDSREISDRFGFKRVSLINDFEAVIYGIPRLGKKELDVLNQGVRDPKGTIAVLGAGTGLGEGFAVYDDPSKRYRVFASEGGHADFAPNNEDEIGLLRYLLNDYGHVSYERILSGSGLFNIYRYLISLGRYEIDQKIQAEIDRSDDPAAVISGAGIKGESEICTRALDLFVSVYGAEAGNLALKILPTGGLYLAGGIAAKITSRLKEGDFLASYLNKGRSEDLLKLFPVELVLNPDVGLIGAAARARDEAPLSASQQ
jgi:glucokinase